MSSRRDGRIEDDETCSTGCRCSSCKTAEMRRDVRIHSQQLDAYQQIEAERDALRNLFAASERNNAEWNRYAMRLSLLLDTMTAERDALRSGSKGEA